VRIKFPQCNWDDADTFFMDRLCEFIDNLWATDEILILALYYDNKSLDRESKIHFI